MHGKAWDGAAQLTEAASDLQHRHKLRFPAPLPARRAGGQSPSTWDTAFPAPHGVARGARWGRLGP